MFLFFQYILIQFSLTILKYQVCVLTHYNIEYIIGLKEDVEEDDLGDVDDWVQCDRECCKKWYHIYCVNKSWDNNVVNADQLWFCCN